MEKNNNSKQKNYRLTSMAELHTIVLALT